MTEQITLQQALELVDFRYYLGAGWRVEAVKGNCITVTGNYITVRGYCSVVEGGCSVVEGDCGTVTGFCGTVGGNCHTVEGHVLNTINGRQWRFVETPKERITQLIKEGASKEKLLKALEEL